MITLTTCSCGKSYTRTTFQALPKIPGRKYHWRRCARCGKPWSSSVRLNHGHQYRIATGDHVDVSDRERVSLCDPDKMRESVKAALSHLPVRTPVSQQGETLDTPKDHGLAIRKHLHEARALIRRARIHRETAATKQSDAAKSIERSAERLRKAARRGR